MDINVCNIETWKDVKRPMITFKTFMRENTDKPVVFSFGRMNPPTLGHAKLINKIIWVANKEGGIPMIFASRTEDKKKNPLSFKTKIAVLKDVYGNIINTDRSIKTPFAALDALNKKGYK